MEGAFEEVVPDVIRVTAQEAGPAQAADVAPHDADVTAPQLDSLALASVQLGQISLKLQYQAFASRVATPPDLADVEFRCFSQNGEDGILLYLTTLVGTKRRVVVEICAGDGIECNGANLIVNHGWHGLLIDGVPTNVARARDFYAKGRNTYVSPPVIAESWVTTGNVNDLLAQRGFVGEVGLLSLDLDGNDYWILKALNAITPDVVVLEFSAWCGPHRAVAMCYREDYSLDVTKQPYRCGASLAAFVSLLRPRGYRLVGVQSLGFNAFFVRNGLADSLVPEISPLECYERTARLSFWNETYLQSILSGPEPWEDVG